MVCDGAMLTTTVRGGALTDRHLIRVKARFACISSENQGATQSRQLGGLKCQPTVKAGLAQD